jgi:hypothetical protein
MSFSNLVDLYNLEKSNVSFFHVGNMKLSFFAENLESYRKEVQTRYDGDEHLSEVLNMLRRIFFKLTGSFLPYSKIISKELKNELLQNFYQVKNSYPELFSTTVIQIAKSFKEVTESIENSMTDHVCNYINENSDMRLKLAIVTKKAISIEERTIIKKGLKLNHNIDFFTENSFRKAINIFDEVIYIGSPNYFGAYVKNTFKGLKITFISYDMFDNSMKPIEEFESIDKKGAYSTLFNQISFGEPIQKKIKMTLEEKESLNIAVNKLLEQQKSRESDITDSVEASIVYLENDRFLFAPRDSKIRIFIPSKKDILIKQVNFKEVEEDDYIVIRNESDTKLIAELADQILGSNAESYRLLQKKWKDRLRYNVEKKGINRVSQILSRKYHLKTASPVSVRNWCNDNSICPTELTELLKALKYNEKDIHEIHSKMKQIKRAHLKAGRLISRKLMTELSTDFVKDLQEQGYYTFTSKEFKGASFNIERIVSIDQSKYLIAPYNLMKPIEVD